MAEKVAVDARNLLPGAGDETASRRHRAVRAMIGGHGVIIHVRVDEMDIELGRGLDRKSVV